MGMSAGGGGSAKSEINVTPLVDVCLVLLIIFMVMVPQNVPEISVRVPAQQAPSRPPRQEALVLGLTKDGSITLNRTVMTRSQLSEQLASRLDARQRKVVFVDFDDDASYGEAVKLLDLAKDSGAEVLGIMKDRDRQTPTTLRG